jgi:hypothetical protein
MSQSLFKLLFIVALSTLIACGDKTKKDPDEGSEGISVLNGKWVSECVANPTPYAGPQGAVITAAVSNNRITTTYDVSETCGKPKLFTLYAISTFKHQDMNNRNGEEPGTYFMDETFNSFELEPTTDLADRWNLHEYCGIKDWKANKRKNVTDKTCDGQNLYSHGTRFNKIKIETANKPYILRLGRYSQALDGSTPSKRPTAFSNDVLVRQ